MKNGIKRPSTPLHSRARIPLTRAWFALHQKLAVALVSFVSLFDVGLTRADDLTVQAIGQQINAANESLRAGEIETAVANYRAIQVDTALQATLNYNLACAEYRQGNLSIAQELFAELAGDDNQALAARARYNLGNCFYTSAVEAQASDAQIAIAALRSAIESYRSSLRLQANNVDARANIELAVKMLKQLEDAPEQEQQPPEQDPQQSPEDSESSPDSQPQDQEQASNDAQADQEEQQSEQPSGQEQKDSQAADEQQAEADTSDPATDDQPGQDADPANEDSNDDSQPESTAESDPQAGEESSSAEPNEQTDEPPDSLDDPAMNKDEPEDAAEESATDASGELTTNNESADAESATAGADRDGLEPDGRRAMSREEAMKLLQAVRDRDMLRRLRQQQREQLRQLPVERDW